MFGWGFHHLAADDYHRIVTAMLYNVKLGLSKPSLSYRGCQFPSFNDDVSRFPGVPPQTIVRVDYIIWGLD
jgi:hypothetical protein